MINYSIGQRYLSIMEPELGLGIVKEIDGRFVLVFFPASDTTRKFAISSAPLKRVEFKIGDTIKSRSGLSFRVASVKIDNGIIIYNGENIILPENDLCDTISFSSPEDLLLNGFIDDNDNFNIRFQTLVNRSYSRKSSIRGFIGGRIDLIPHQLYVSHEVSSRNIPRVLLSDETGLGKTIEACLVIHRLLINERISRVLILVPETLVHQWLIELMRRFNIIFRIFDKELCESIEETDETANPFLGDQLGLCTINFLTSYPKWGQKAIDAGWDMLIIDEAHHLVSETPAYNFIKDLSSASQGLMLLTATPEQLGHVSHFSRLKLIDPARYYNFDIFEKEEKNYLELARIINKLLECKKLTNKDVNKLINMSPEKYLEINENLADSLKDENFRNQFIEELIDQNGTGRAVYRNTRGSIKGFPKRIPHLVPLDSNEEILQLQTFEFNADQNKDEEEITFNFKNDPRIKWLVQFLKNHSDKKVLLICQSMEKVLAIEQAIIPYKFHIALFHENLTLLQRDRNANWFSQIAGAQILICSEIGSEGRNFQFSHNLILFDLPLNPELLEQRIGRLDRIGQEHAINIYIPYIFGSEYEIIAKWYNEGIDALRQNIPGVYILFQNLGSELEKMAREKQFFKLNDFLKITQKQHIEIAEALKKGRDHLLELNSFRPKIAENLVNQIKKIDMEMQLEKFMINVFNFFGIREELLSERTYKLSLSLLSSPDFPIPLQKKDDFIVTFERKTAIEIENIEFLTWDHPMVLGAMDLLLGSEKGNCAVCVWPDQKETEILLEAIFVLECIAPKNIYADRFLPPTPLRVLINHSLQDCTEKYSAELILNNVKNVEEENIFDNPRIKQELVPEMINECKSIAEKNAPNIINNGLTLMKTTLTKEISRLVELKKVNKNIKEEEILIYRKEMKQLEEAILASRLRLDSLRLISRGKP